MSQKNDWLNQEPPVDHVAKSLERAASQLTMNRKKTRQKNILGFFASLSFVALVAFVFISSTNSSITNMHPVAISNSNSLMMDIAQIQSSEDIELMASSDLDFEDLEDLQVIESLDQGV